MFPILLSAAFTELSSDTNAVLGCGNSNLCSAIAVCNLFALNSIPAFPLIINTPEFCNTVSNPIPRLLFITPPRTKHTVFFGSISIFLPSPSQFSITSLSPSAFMELITANLVQIIWNGAPCFLQDFMIFSTVEPDPSTFPSAEVIQRTVTGSSFSSCKYSSLRFIFFLKVANNLFASALLT